jgi:cytochrome c oxidase subunit 3
MRGLCITAGFGILFLCIKAYEYYEEYRDHLMPFSGSPSPFSRPGEQLFFNFYLAGTSLHALHLTIGIALVAGLVLRIAWVRPYLPERAVTVEVMGLYWHLVDVVWVFIYPVFYLAR